jgi:hypothetical protein
MLSEIFSIPFLICLSISILLIGCSSIYFYQRITQQDHKIESMVSLISSMAEELKGGQPQVKPFVAAPSQVCMPVHSVPVKASTLIPVSDGEDSDSEDEDSESEDSDSEDSDSENNSTYSDSDDENHIEIIGSVAELKEMDELDELAELNELEELEDEEPKEFNGDDIKSIHLEDSLLDNLSLFKSIHISGSESDTQMDSITIEESTNYKKMPIQKLREIAQVQGHGDVSKLKKNELLKLLGVE